NLKAKVIISTTDQINYIGSINKKIIFYVNEHDSKYLSMPPKELAIQWAENINQEIIQIADNRKKVEINNLISMPVPGTYKRLQLEIAQLKYKIAQEQIVYNNLFNEAQQISMQYAQTPSAFPINTAISSPFGLRKHPITMKYRFHTGVDFWAWPGSRVYATASGRVVYTGWYSGYGNTVKIYHGRGIHTLYGHNSKLLVSNGAWVRKGQVIALSGASGLTNGAHLHYEVRKWEMPINPVAFLNIDVMTAAKKRE
ncbi:MAG: M23 family metallopeptidase, partial [Candidatus Margulisbacteria bacterium]|nr:M23 family metallopeptidase [Candidatus Margulisiibacteriota bacterium]